MQVPDAAVYASIPTVFACLLWMGRQFVLDTAIKGDKGDKGDAGQSMTIRDYKDFSAFLMSQLNGRYLMAPEAREKFSELNSKLDAMRLEFSLHVRIEENDREQRLQQHRPPSGEISLNEVSL